MDDLLSPGDEGYDDARRIYNGLIDRRPASIARCATPDHIRAALDIARDRDLLISVRGGGHNVAGAAVIDGGLMIDVSPMKDISIDAPRRRVAVGPGITWKELNAATQVHGLAVTGGFISSTGVAGLTLGGGIGTLMGKHGLASDNLVSADVVAADGRLLTANEHEHPDLHWALRGGGGNFGVVSSFVFRLHEVGPTVTGGVLFHPFRAAGGLLRTFRDLTQDASDDLAVAAALVHDPNAPADRHAGLIIGHFGSSDAARRELEPYIAFGSPASSHVGPMRYRVMNSLLDRAYPWGSYNYWKSGFLRDLTDDSIDLLVDLYAACPSSMTTILIEHFHGAVTRVPVAATAFPHRAPGYNVLITSVWLDRAASEANIAWTRHAFASLAPYLAPGRYANYLADDDTGGRVVNAAFGPNLKRLRDVKRAYDPDDMFRGAVPIPGENRGAGGSGLGPPGRAGGT